MLLNGVVVLLRMGSLAAIFYPEAARRVAADPMIQSLGMLNALTAVLYYGVLEGFWGWSLGKRLMRLRVCRLDSSGPPGLGRAVLRAGVFYFLFYLTTPVFWMIRLSGLVPRLNPEEFQVEVMQDPLRAVPQMLLLSAVGVIMWVGGKALLFGTMRKRNGYRGLHEFASGTRVLRVTVWEKRRSLWSRRPHADVAPGQRPAGVSGTIGPYAVTGVIWSMADEEALLAEDPGLQRRVWVWRRSRVRPAFSAARREVSRMGRLRWLACGVEGDSQWDAFLAPTGFPLIELIQTEGRLSWPEARPVLAELTEELAAATEGQTLPGTLGVDQVWVQSNERMLLLDRPFTSPAEAIPSNPGDGEWTTDKNRDVDMAEVVTADQTDSERALAFLRRLATWVLEGRPRPTDRREPIQAPMPGPASRLFDRLLDRRQPFRSVQEFKATLQGIRDQPAEVTPSRRLWHLTIQTALLFTGLFCCMPVISIGTSPNYFTVQALDDAIAINEIAREDLQAGSTGELIAGCLNTDPWVRLTAVANWGADQKLEEELQHDWQAMTRERDGRVPELSWF